MNQSKTISLFCLSLFLATAVFLQPESCQAQEKRRFISLEISSDAKAPMGTQQQWMQMLQKVGADRVTSRTGRAEAPTVEETQTAATTYIQVNGFIGSRKLFLPGGSFAINDVAGIKALLKKIRDDGATVALAEKMAFGLTSEQLVGLHDRLAKKVEFTTKGQKAGDVIKKIVKQSGLDFVYDRAARAAINGEEKVLEELNGISSGTALAAILRPLGLVLEPSRKQGKELKLQILDSRASKENWPIGWPIERTPIEAEPKLFETLPIEIRAFPLKTALDAVEKRGGVLFLYDHNTMAREGIELDQVKATLVQKKISLKVAIGKLLKHTKPKLWDEIRVDENGKTFLWISTRE